MIPLYAAALGAAAHDLRRGVRESRANAGREIDHMLRNAGITVAAPWCAAFVQDVTDSAARALGVVNPLDAVKLEALVQSYVNWAESEGRMFRDASKVVPGDLVCFKFAPYTRWNHIGIVRVPPTAEGVLKTIEGNTNVAGSREGDGVYEKSRNVVKDRVCFIRWAGGVP